jgi:putative transposase
MRVESIKLKKDELKFLSAFVKAGIRNSKEFERAYILLALHKGKKHSEIEDFYNVSRITIWRVKKKYGESGARIAIKEEARPGQPVKYGEKQEAEIVATACTKAPEGRVRWTLKLLEKELKKRQGMETINRETIRIVLKKKNVSLG